MLGVPGGAVDLRSGKLLDAEREQYITRRCSVSPVEGPHPLFDMVLGRACADHEGMREYLLRWFGYMLTGDVREEAFIFLHGPGGSGKSTLIKAITEIMGEYAVSISMDAFMEQKHPRHSQEIAKLAGMRLVYASETEEGRRWNEALIKDLTGRDTVTAHKMRMDDFSFKPTFKLLLYGNSVPHLKSVGEEIRRRIHLIEYGASLAQEDRDTTLKDRLVKEYPAILATLVKGCVDWQDCGGLGKPESVNLSVDEYLEGEDSLAGFIAECIEAAPQGRETTGAVYRRFKSWAASTGEYAGSQKRLVTALRHRGYAPQKSGGARFITGIKLLPAPGPEYPPPYQDRD
jgi:putative DNA primase/helicase